MIKYLALSITCALALTGCQLGPQYAAPEMDVPCQWQDFACDGMTEESPDCFLWWQALNDPILTSLIERAAMQNLDVSIASMRVLEARVQAKGEKWGVLPHIDGSVACGHALFNRKFVDEVTGGAGNKRDVNYFEVGFDADWELDFFGLRKHEIAAANLDEQAAEEGLLDVWVTLSAEVAKNYIQLRGYQLRLAILLKNIHAQQDTLHLTQQLLHIGMLNTLDLRQAQEQLSQLLAEEPLLRQSVEKSIYRLSILLGYMPSELICELAEVQPLPQLPCEKPIGVPSELLRRRPDIRQSERELAAASERVGSAIASLFPRLSLTGFLGDISGNLHGLLNSPSNTLLVGPQLLMPLFNSKLIQQSIDLNKIKVCEAFYKYQKKVLEALEETENAIAAYHYELKRTTYLADAKQGDQDSLELTLQLYERGLKNYLEVQQISRSFLASEDALVQTQINLLLDYVAIYKALGGGWELGWVCDVCQGQDE